MLITLARSLPSGLSPARVVEAARSIDLPSPRGALEELRDKVRSGRDAISSFAQGNVLEEGKEIAGRVFDKVADLRENGLTNEDRVRLDGVERTARGAAHTHTAVSDLLASENRVFRPDQPRSQRDGKAADQVRVSSWNLHHGTSPDGQGARDTLTAQIESIKKSGSDVVMLQEVLPWQVEEIVEKTGMTGYYSQTTARQGNMVLVDPSLKVVANRRETLNYDFDKNDKVDALKASWETKAGEPRAAQALTIERPDGKGEFTVFNTHLSTANATPEQRQAESQKFQRFVQSSGGQGAAIGGGDLNMGASNSMLEGFRESGYTVEGDRIDHLLSRGVASSEIAVSDPHQGSTRLSDHPMVSGDYRLG